MAASLPSIPFGCAQDRLVALDIGLHILGRHELDLMPKLFQLLRPAMRPRTGLDTAMGHGGSVAKNSNTVPRDSFLRNLLAGFRYDEARIGNWGWPA